MNNTTTEHRMHSLTAAGIATVRDAATKLGTQDPERIRNEVAPKISPEHWATLLASAGVLV